MNIGYLANRNTDSGSLVMTGLIALGAGAVAVCTVLETVNIVICLCDLGSLVFHPGTRSFAPIMRLGAVPSQL